MHSVAAPETLMPLDVALLSPAELKAGAETVYRLAKGLSAEMAHHLCADFCDVWDSITTLPDNMLTLLHSPQGWTAIAGMIAFDLGAAAKPFVPTVH
ncbi:hypothetical protein [Sphingomonas sanxanigenens]|uniref:Uncharacterized protein n=1 Tax=Sphingomonas sanxanigenens DSM 19645 = NX02 TaxID=1123269 RepID=W0A4D2_9SPHN|nr:hypothetical protein [Sphingomonas sanxanigenens]AHE52819.1 hypothetical protein NX02_05400 [Sphingomonas sanxanigenens DSM 19645 = NX02]